MTNEVFKRKHLLMVLKECASSLDIIYRSETAIEDVANRYMKAHSKYDFMNPEGDFLKECNPRDWLKHVHNSDASFQHLTASKPKGEDEYDTVHGPYKPAEFDALPPHIRLEMANRFAARQVKLKTYGS
jgi:hypothetical protein